MCSGSHLGKVEGPVISDRRPTRWQCLESLQKGCALNRSVLPAIAITCCPCTIAAASVLSNKKFLCCQNGAGYLVLNLLFERVHHWQYSPYCAGYHSCLFPWKDCAAALVVSNSVGFFFIASNKHMHGTEMMLRLCNEELSFSKYTAAF